MAARRKKYQEVWESLAVDDYLLEGNLDEIIARLQAVKAQYSKHLSLHLDFGYGESDADLRGCRLETDKERSDRLTAGRMQKKAAAKRKQNADEEEKQEFFRLHEKFGHLL